MGAAGGELVFQFEALRVSLKQVRGHGHKARTAITLTNNYEIDFRGIGVPQSGKVMGMDQT